MPFSKRCPKCGSYNVGGPYGSGKCLCSNCDHWDHERVFDPAPYWARYEAIACVVQAYACPATEDKDRLLRALDRAVV